MNTDIDFGNQECDLLVAGAGLLGLTALHEILLSLSKDDNNHLYKQKNGKPLRIVMIDGSQTCLESSRYSLAVSAMRSARPVSQEVDEIRPEKEIQYSIHELGITDNWKMAMDRIPGVYPALLLHDKKRSRFQKYDFNKSIEQIISLPEFVNLKKQSSIVSDLKDSLMFSYCEKAIYFHSKTYLNYLLNEITKMALAIKERVKFQIIKSRIVQYFPAEKCSSVALSNGNTIKSSFIIWATGSFQVGEVIGQNRLKVKERPLKIKKVFGQFLSAPIKEPLMFMQKIELPFWEIEHDMFKIVYNGVDKQIYIGTSDFDENSMDMNCLLPNVQKLNELYKSCFEYLAPLKINLPAWSNFSPVTGVRSKGPKGQPFYQEIEGGTVVDKREVPRTEFALLVPYKNGFTLHRPMGKRAAQWFLQKGLS